MDFLEDEAELASSSDESSVPSGSGSDEDDAPRKRKKKSKPKKKKRKVVLSDDEEDGEELDQDLEDLIDDNPDIDQEGDDEEDGEGKRKHEDESELEEDLDDEDYALLEDNLGIKVKRKQKRKRIRMLQSDEESAKSSSDGEDDRDAIAKEIFEGDVDEAPPPEEEESQERAPQAPADYGDLEQSDEESDIDNWIVDEEGQPISKGKKKKHIIHDDAALQEAQDIFGVDFDFEEFDQMGEGSEEEEEEEEYEDEEQEGDEEPRPRPGKAKKKKHRQKATIFEVFEPSELERGHFTDQDQEIRVADMPERFQLRRIPVCPTEDGELEDEASWIYKFAFMTAPISTQEYFSTGDKAYGSSASSRKGPGTVDKIRDALNFMRNQQFEVPFIAFYRKEYVEPDLNINDLWKVYKWDEKWMQLRTRKQNLVRLFEKMQEFQFDQIDPSKPLESHIRTLTEEDVERAKGVQSLEELRDIYQHFLLYYGMEVPKMKVALKAKRRKERAAEAAEGEDAEREEDDHEDDQLKQATRKTGYTMCVSAGLAELARKFGLTPEQFGENMRDNYQRHEVEQDPAEPEELAAEFIKEQFRATEDVLKGARHMVAMQIAHDPLTRDSVRETFYERAKITCHPTKKGIKEIDESHPCYSYKYLKNKPVRELEEDQFLRMCQAEDDHQLTYEIHLDMNETHKGTTYFEEIRQLYYRDEFSHVVQEWNTQRSQALERALTMILYPQMVKEIKGKLIEEAKESVLKSCCRKLYNWLKVAPYHADQQLDEEDEEYDAPKGLRVMGLAYSSDRSEASFCAVVDGDGEVSDFMRLLQLLTRKNTWRERDREEKETEMAKVKDFIAAKKPHVIVVAGTDRVAVNAMEDLRGIVAELEQEQQMAPINVELVDNELAHVYACSKKGEQEFREYPVLLRQAISLARRLQDPLIEFSQLCNPDEDILALKYHNLQDSINKEDLLNGLNLEFVNRVNEVGVDVNMCVLHNHMAPLVQFVCGLGPRKGYHLLKILKQNNTRLENRTQLVTMCHMGPKVFINCAGFIKIDTTALGDSTEAYVEVLDGSRVHPETYEWARKMAVDALEYDDTAEDANPAGALEEILESPERLKDLDLDAFAEELERQGYGNKHITLYDIRAELNHRYKDLRVPYRAPTIEDRFNMLTKESPQTFPIGKLIMCQVAGIAHRRPRREELDQANPVRNDDTQLWQCPFCQKNEFPELSEVWNHFDAGECPGQAVGVKTRLDNGVSGFIPLRQLSDKKVTNPEERVHVGMLLHCRITKIDIEQFNVELSSKTSDLVDKESKWRLQKDAYFDFETEEEENKKEEEKKKQKARQTYVKRVIAHPSFQNIDYKTCEKVMANMEQGDVIIRPSSKGTDHLTVTWKVSPDGINQHIDVKEEGKENAFSLGSSLWIDRDEFEDLDEIIARHIQPIAAFARDIINYRYYKDSEGGKREIMDKFVIEEKKRTPSKIPYFFSSSKQYPGKFMLSYLPRKTPKHEFVTVTPEGFRYRSQLFHSLNSVVRWFKEHFRDPIPGASATPSLRTPLPAQIGSTPTMNMGRVDVATIQRAAAGLPSNVYNTLAQVAGQTPAPGYGLPFGQTPLMTPLMTPSYHTGQGMTTPAQPMATPIIATPAQQPMATPVHQPMATPQYVTTPRTNWNQPGATPSARTPGAPPAAAAAAAANQRGRPQGRTPGGSSSHDWAKMAEMWAKRQHTSEPRRTPQADASPDDTRGDATPLFDER